MRIILGDEFTENLKEKIEWIRSTFKEDQYRIRDIGFLYNDYAVEFTDESYETLYLMRYPK